MESFHHLHHRESKWFPSCFRSYLFVPLFWHTAEASEDGWDGMKPLAPCITICKVVIAIFESVFVFAIFRQAGPVQLRTVTRSDNDTGSNVPYSLKGVCGFFNIPANQYREETGEKACGLLKISNFGGFFSNNLTVSWFNACATCCARRKPYVAKANIFA